MKTNGDQLQLLSDRQTARALTVSTATLRHWRAVGQGPPWVRVGDRLVRYEASALRRWIEERAEVREPATREVRR